MYLICVMFLCFLSVLVIILFMCCIGLCSNCFSYWIAQAISGAFALWELPVPPHLLYAVYLVFVYCVYDE